VEHRSLLSVHKNLTPWTLTGNRLIHVRFEFLTAVKEMSMLVFWVVTPCGLVGSCQCFGGTYCFHLQGYKFTRHYNPEDQHRQINPVHQSVKISFNISLPSTAKFPKKVLPSSFSTEILYQMNLTFHITPTLFSLLIHWRLDFKTILQVRINISSLQLCDIKRVV
jgi:hypothetical protein